MGRRSLRKQSGGYTRFVTGVTLRIVALVVFVSMAIVPVTMPAAYAQTTVTESENPSLSEITQKHSFAKGTPEPEISPRIERDGRSYELVEVPAVMRDVSHDPTTKDANRDVEFAVDAQDIKRLSQIIPATSFVQDGTFAGELTLDATNPYTIVAVYEIRRAQVDRTVTVVGLPDNDATRLEQQRSFEVRAATAPEATTFTDLALAEVAHEPVKINSLGLITEYAAHLVYRGYEDFLVVTRYQVTAHYVGMLVDQTVQLALEPVYREVRIPEAEVPLAALAVSPPPPYVAAASTVILLLAGLLLWFFRFRNNMRFVRVVGAEPEGRVLFKRHLCVRDGLCALEIPRAIELHDGARYVCVLKPSLAKQSAYLLVIWRGLVLAQEPLREQIAVNVQELLIADSQYVLGEYIDGLAAEY